MSYNQARLGVQPSPSHFSNIDQRDWEICFSPGNGHLRPLRFESATNNRHTRRDSARDPGVPQRGASFAGAGANSLLDAAS
jgi:hypothetical protein